MGRLRASTITLSDIAYSTVANPGIFTIIPNSAVNYTSGGNVNLASLTASGGVLAGGVSALCFDFGAQENDYVVMVQAMR